MYKPGQDTESDSGGLGWGTAVEKPCLKRSQVKYDDSDDVGSKGFAGSMREDGTRELRAKRELRLLPRSGSPQQAGESDILRPG